MSTEGSYDPEEHPLSASKLKTYNRCPKQFDLKYVQGLEPAAQDRYYLDIGDAVHDTLEAYLTGHDGVWPPQPSIKTALLDILSEHVPEGGLDSEQRETVVDCLDTAAEWLAKNEPTIRDVEGEANFRVDRADMSAPFIGYMDLTTEGPDEIVDWKTGKSDGKDLDEALQGSVYMAGFYERYGVVPEKIHYVYLKEGTVHTLEPDDDLWATLLSKARMLLSGADNDSFEGQPDDSKCHWCDYEPYCPASPVGAGDIDWETYP